MKIEEIGRFKLFLSEIDAHSVFRLISNWKCNF